MYKILTFNAIAAKGLDRLSRDKYETSSETQNPDAIILRSHKLHDYQAPKSLLAIGRAGAGVNNIPVEKMSQEGVVVFNAPGANANAVKELVIAGMLLAARNILPAWQYTKALTQTDDAALNVEVEAGKKQYVGYELPEKTLLVVGLGAVGVKVANAAVDLGMNVIGFDPVMTIANAWQLSSKVKRAGSVEEGLRMANFVSFHVPLLDATANMLNAERIKLLPKGAVVLNLARGGIVDDGAVLAALQSAQLSAFVTDFPSVELQNQPGVIALPHLGASTAEAEENCAIMVAEQIKDYLENGNIQNAVNFPNVQLARQGQARVAIVNVNQPNMVRSITSVFGDANVNICNMVNNSRDQIAYTLVDVESPVDEEVISQIQAIDGVLKVRVI